MTFTSSIFIKKCTPTEKIYCWQDKCEIPDNCFPVSIPIHFSHRNSKDFKDLLNWDFEGTFCDWICAYNYVFEMNIPFMKRSAIIVDLRLFASWISNIPVHTQMTRGRNHRDLERFGGKCTLRQMRYQNEIPTIMNPAATSIPKTVKKYNQQMDQKRKASESKKYNDEISTRRNKRKQRIRNILERKLDFYVTE